jgi:ethanolamine permease
VTCCKLRGLSSLEKALGPISIWGLGVGYVISGMYFGWNLGLPVGGVLGLGLATVAVTVFYVAFVLGYTELACALPKAGGVFVYAGRAFGPNLGFVAGIVQILEYTLAPAACSFAIGAYVNQAVPTLPIHLIAIAAYVVFTAINIWGVSLTVRFEIVMTVLAVIELGVFGFVVLPHFSWARFAEDPLPHGFGGAFAALPFAMWFYLGIEGMANIAEETKNASRDLPRGFFAAMATLVVLTAITLFGAVGAAGWHGVVYPDPSDLSKTSDSPLPLAIAHVISRDSPYFLALTGVGLVGLIASFHGTLVASSRALMELGRARYLPAGLGVVHPRRHTPVNALVVNFAIGLMAIAIGRTDELIVFSVFGALALYLFASASVLRLRASEPGLLRPYRTPLYPVPPIVAVLLGLVCLAAMVYSHPFLALIFAGVVGIGWLGFLWFVPPERRRTFTSG